MKEGGGWHIILTHIIFHIILLAPFVYRDGGVTLGTHHTHSNTCQEGYGNECSLGFLGGILYEMKYKYESHWSLISETVFPKSCK